MSVCGWLAGLVCVMLSVWARPTELCRDTEEEREREHAQEREKRENAQEAKKVDSRAAQTSEKETGERE